MAEAPTGGSAGGSGFIPGIGDPLIGPGATGAARWSAATPEATGGTGCRKWALGVAAALGAAAAAAAAAEAAAWEWASAP